jgi:hypothetical protein
MTPLTKRVESRIAIGETVGVGLGLREDKLVDVRLSVWVGV